MKRKSNLKKNLFFFLFGILLLNFISTSQENEPLISIDVIEEDQYIEGTIINLDRCQKYKVLVYVHTNIWYIHPYAELGEGFSWAPIDSNCTWKIQTKFWGFPANSVAVLIVDSNVTENAPSKPRNIHSIRNHAITIYKRSDLEEKDWYGKL